MIASWYLHRLRAMGPREIARRVGDAWNEELWRLRYFDRGCGPHPRLLAGERYFSGRLGRERAVMAPQQPRAKLLKCADRILDGHWWTFAIERHDVTAQVDWHWDAKGGTRASANAFAFDIRPYGGNSSFDAKYVWELSRHHQTTVLAMAWWLTADDRYARAAAAQIAAWKRGNPFLHGVHWASGIELGMRLIAFSWTRRLLDGWPSAPGHFESNGEFIETVYRHQWLLARRMSFGSSANNHLIYEAAGLFIAASCMPWFSESARWLHHTRAILEREFARQTFPSGYNRELASDYNGFVFEALLLFLAEENLAHRDPAAHIFDTGERIAACLAEVSDCRGRPPRQGDGDDARGLLLDAPGYDRWADLAHLSQAWFGNSRSPASREPPSLRSWLLTPLAAPRTTRRTARPAIRDDAGLVILRARSGEPSEIYCVFDVGPLGYMRIAAHGHADALAVELRYGGRPLLVDPGTFTYVAGVWRDYFRSTAAHNTIELGGTSQSASGGPFLWRRQARTKLLDWTGLGEGAPRAETAARHWGYSATGFRGQHKRTVTLERLTARLAIKDEVTVSAPARCRAMFHLHPAVVCKLEGTTAVLRCPAVDSEVQVRLVLPAVLSWRALRASLTPIAGWYSPAYDTKIATTTLVGEADVEGSVAFETLILLPE